MYVGAILFASQKPVLRVTPCDNIPLTCNTTSIRLHELSDSKGPTVWEKRKTVRHPSLKPLQMLAKLTPKKYLSMGEDPL